jgi:hypothetical protein
MIDDYQRHRLSPFAVRFLLDFGAFLQASIATPT